MTRFAISLSCSRGNRSRHTCFIVEAISAEEAEGRALVIGRKAYPVDAGFHGHNVVVSSLDNVVTVETIRVFA